MPIQNSFLIKPPADAGIAKSPSRRGGGGMVGGQSPFANMMAQEQSGKAVGLQMGAQAALSLGLKGLNEQMGGVPTGAMVPKGMGNAAVSGASAQEQAMASLAQGLGQGSVSQRAASQGSSGGTGRGGEYRGAVGAAPNRVDITRTNNYARAQMDLQRTNALDTIAQGMSGGDSLLDSARNAVTTRNLRSVVGGFNLKAPVMPMADSIKSQAIQGSYGGGRSGKSRKNMSVAANSGPSIGTLAAKFESGKDGIAAIGYDRHGGTSYGKYQIASRVGSMDNFLNFLDTAAPDIAKTLRSAGPANTGSRSGGMPTAWREIAAAQPDRFEALQEKFIYDSHYKPALEAVTKNTPLEEGKISSAMQEVLWSTAVQHGPTGAARIFGRAAEQTGKVQGQAYDKKLINEIYEIRAEQFGSSTASVQDSVRNRLEQERKLALNMLSGKKTGHA